MIFSALYKKFFTRIFLDLFSRGTFFVVNILIARSLAASAYGRFTYAISLTQMFYIFTDLGTHLQLIKELGERRGSEKNSWENFYSLKIFLTGLCFFVFIFLTYFIWPWENHLIPILLFILMASNSFLDFNQFICNGLDRLDKARNILFIQRSLIFLSIILGFLFFKSLLGISVCLALGSMTGFFFSNLFFIQNLKIKFSFKSSLKEWSRILKSSFPLGIGGAFGSWYLRIGAVILAWFVSDKALGEYGAAFRLFEISYIIPASVMSIAVPHLAESLTVGLKKFKKESGHIFIIMSLSGFFWFSVLYFGSPLLISVLFGENYAAAVPILRVLSISGGLVFLNYAVTHMMVVINKQNRHACHQVLVFLICFVATLNWVPGKSMMGAAWALVLTETTLFLVTVIYLGRWFNKEKKFSMEKNI